MTQDSNPSAKAAQQIADKYAQQYYDAFKRDSEDFHSQGKHVRTIRKEFVENLILAALSDSLRPYRELLERLRRDEADCYKRSMNERGDMISDWADELEALIKEAGK